MISDRMKYVVLEEGRDAPWMKYFRNSSSIAVGAMKDGKLVSYAVYSKETNDTEYIYLEYIYTMSGYREQYAASDLLEHMENVWKSEGYAYILARIVEEDAAASPAYRLLISNYFSPLQEENKIFVYRLDGIKSSDRLKKLLVFGQNNYSVVHIGSRRNKEYKEFATALKNRGTDIDNVSFNTSLSCFVRQKNGTINGCALIDKTADGILIKYIYVSRQAGKYALMYLLSEMIMVLKDCKNSETISIVLNGKSYIDFFMYFFPDYIKSYDMWDYIFEL